MILERILDSKRRELEAARQRCQPELLARRAEAVPAKPRDFTAAVRGGPPPRVIAELKRRSPSKGEIRPNFDLLACARSYAAGGAAALSVLTDEPFFGGRLEFLSAVRQEVELPLLRKDFVIDAYQVDEARLAGADAVLLIVAALERAPLRQLLERATALGLASLVEVHDEAELEVALDCGARLVGINNRDLQTFETDLAVTEKLAPLVPDEVTVVAESGLFEPEDVERLGRAGAHAFLVGESLMRQEDVAHALRRLRRSS